MTNTWSVWHGRPRRPARRPGRGFARLLCEDCGESRLVAFSCKGRGFCPSTFPFSWRRRLAQDGALLGRLTRIVVGAVLRFYAARAAQEGGLGAKSGAVTVAQRPSSDLRLKPHLAG